MCGPNNVIFSAAHATFDESMFPRCPKTVPYMNTRLREVAPPAAPCTGSTCQCPIPPQDNEELPPHQPALVQQGSSMIAEKQIDQTLQDVGVTPSQRQGMRIPPPWTSAWQDRPPTPDRIKGKQRQVVPIEGAPSERPSSDLPLPLPRRHQPAALPPLVRSQLGSRGYLSATQTQTSMGRSTLFRWRRISNVKGTGREWLVRSLVVPGDKPFPGEFLFRTLSPTTRARGETQGATLRGRSMMPLAPPLPPVTRRWPDSPGRGE